MPISNLHRNANHANNTIPPAMWTAEGSVKHLTSSHAILRPSIKCLSRYSISTLTGGTDSPPPNLHELKSRQEHLSKRASKFLILLGGQHDRTNILSKSIVTSLQEIYAPIEDEGLKLLSYMEDEQALDRNTTPWHVWLCQNRAHSYLKIIEETLESPHCSLFDYHLKSILQSLSGQEDGSDANEFNSTTVSISPWTLPSLAFDVGVSKLLDIENVSKNMPLRLQVRTVSEIFARDIIKNDAMIPELKMCSMKVVKCLHRSASRSFVGGFVGRAGIVGEVLLVLKVFLSSERVAGITRLRTSSDLSVSTQSSVSDDIVPVVVREARMYQTNAIPPNPRMALDLYTSSQSYGREDDLTVTIRFQTRETIDKLPPCVQVDLVVN